MTEAQKLKLAIHFRRVARIAKAEAKAQGASASAIEAIEANVAREHKRMQRELRSEE